MAETIRQKTARWVRRDFTKTELMGIIGGLVADGAIDVATGGRLSKLKLAALKKTFTLSRPVVSLGGRIAGQAALGTARVLGSSALGAAAPIVTNPYALGLGLGYGALQTQPGQDLLEAAGERGRMDRIRFEQALTDVEVGAGKAVKKTKSTFNKAVSAGMKAAKNSASYGKKGVINAPKKVFTTVTKIASKINEAKKGKKRMPLRPNTRGPRVIYDAIKGIFK
jgi:hypothetical protein